MIDMSEAETPINKLIEEVGDSHYCAVCLYKSRVSSQIKEHVETHIHKGFGVLLILSPLLEDI